MTVNPNPTPTFKAHGRHTAIDAKWLEHVEERTLQLDRFGNGITHFDVEISHNSNPSRQPMAWRVEIAAKMRKHTIRATGQAADPQRAFAEAREVMESNLRRAARKMHWSRHGRRATLTASQVVS